MCCLILSVIRISSINYSIISSNICFWLYIESSLIPVRVCAPTLKFITFCVNKHFWIICNGIYFSFPTKNSPLKLFSKVFIVAHCTNLHTNTYFSVFIPESFMFIDKIYFGFKHGLRSITYL